jgi:hypothetical protein
VYPLGLSCCLLLALPLVAAEPLLKIPPARATVEIDHQPVVLTASGTVWKAAQPDSYALALAVDLADLQAHARQMLAAQLDRSQPCGERLTILDAALQPTQPTAALTAKMHFERWTCAKLMGRTINKRLVGGDGNVRVELMPVVEAGTRVRLEAEVRDIQADGSLGQLLRSGSLGAELKEKIRSSVQSALDKATDFRATLPAVLQDLVRLRSVSFHGAGEGRLELTIDAEASISPGQLEKLRAEVARPLSTEPRPSGSGRVW